MAGARREAMCRAGIAVVLVGLLAAAPRAEARSSLLPVTTSSTTGTVPPTTVLPLSGSMAWTGLPLHPALDGTGCVAEYGSGSEIRSIVTVVVVTWFVGGGHMSTPTPFDGAPPPDSTGFAPLLADAGGHWSFTITQPLPGVSTPAMQAPTWAVARVVRAQAKCTGGDGIGFAYASVQYQIGFRTGPPQRFAVPGPFDYQVPVGACAVTVDAVGAAGSPQPATWPGHGGAGDEVVATLPVTAGEVLHGIVAGRAVGDLGGIGGGGNATGDWRGGGGGGASDVRQGSAALTARVVVAGGGGGASVSVFTKAVIPNHDVGTEAENGGDAGRDGGVGTIQRFDYYEQGHPTRPHDPPMLPNTPGRGATAEGPGAAGTVAGRRTESGTPGTLGQGGDGATLAGGGGGGGYFGGGGGASADINKYFYLHGDISTGDILTFVDTRPASGGGGGSSWVADQATPKRIIHGAGTGDGRVEITPLSGTECPASPSHQAPPETASPAAPVQARAAFTG